MNPLSQGEQNRIVGASLLVIATVVVPSLIAWYWPGSISRSVLMVIAGLGGCVAGRIVAAAPGERMRAHLGAMFGGVIAGLGGAYAATWWLEGRSSVHASEVVLAVVIGAVPGVIIAGKLYLALRRPVERVPHASVR
jgi:hypothetical protein